MGSDKNIILGAAIVEIDDIDIGYTSGGVTLRYEPAYTDVKADQAVGTVKKFRNDEVMTVTVPMLEITLQRIRQAMNYPAAMLAGSTLMLGYNNACLMQENVIVLTGMAPDCRTRTFTLNRCVSVGSLEYGMSREDETVLEVEFECLKDSAGRFGMIVDS